MLLIKGTNMVHNVLKISFICFISLSFQSCATYKTVVPSSQRKLVQYVESVDNEYCVTIPRVYSGINYTYCVMCGDAKLTSSHTDAATIPFDFIADTLLLPYTVIRQVVDGNLVLKKEIKSAEK
jgi:uncharacterized protein YceK